MSRFLLAFLSIETILQETTIYRRRQRLRAMGKGLNFGGAYGPMLGRIKAQSGEKARLGMAVLGWISHSRRPLQVDEICQAVSIRIGSNDLDGDDIPTISTLLDCCLGLVAVDKGASTVRLIHFTLQEYLCTHPDLFYCRAHSTMAEACLTYLNFQHVKNLSVSSSPDPRDTALLKYSSVYWGTHMRMEHSALANSLALQLLTQFDNHISAKSLWKSIKGELGFYYSPDDKPFSALHCTSYFGITKVTNTFLEMNKWDVNQIDGLGRTPLIWAAIYGHEEVVRLLLQEIHIQPERQDMYHSRTALSWAAQKGHEGVVKLLLGREDVNPESSNEYGQTPLLWAAEKGHEGVVKLLLERKDVNPDGANDDGYTPLSLAAVNSHEGVVKLLLGRGDVNPDIPNEYGQTPLVLAAKNGHEGVVKLLLGRKDVNPDSSCKFGYTPLSSAAAGGYEGIMNRLLERKNVNPESLNQFGQTPLALAARNGHEGVVKLLLGRGDVKPGRSNKYGIAPLSCAAMRGREGVVKLLLERKDVNPDSSCQSGRTPLWFAARDGHDGVVKLLLERRDVNPNSFNKSGQTPIMIATKKGHDKVVELLQTRHSQSFQ